MRESKVSELFRKCRCEEGMLIPDDNAGPNGNMPHHIAYRDAIFEKIKR